MHHTCAKFHQAYEKKTLKNLIPGLADKDATARRTSAMIQADVMSMKRKRQCSLEWEFLATILDRIFLIFFILIVLITTLGMMMTGHLAQYQYDLEG
uniref:Neur_chan_memb domain-containing protein n=1 Tax=Bursaphelenchus xylophilus TaxID=6326 RepID=A0A1I7SQW2_BURXY